MRYVFLLLAMVLPAMAGREFVAGSSQDGRSTITSISPPITMSVWAWPKQDTAAIALFALNSADHASERLGINQAGTSSGDPFALIVVNDAGTSTSVTPSTGGESNTSGWQHVAGVFTSSTLRVLYVGGSPIITNSTSRVADGLTLPSIGSRKASSYGAFWTGGIAEAAIWSVALTADEIASLASGAAPYMVRPASLVFYAPLTGRETATEWDLEGGPITLNNSPAPSTTHPRIYRP